MRLSTPASKVGVVRRKLPWRWGTRSGDLLPHPATQRPLPGAWRRLLQPVAFRGSLQKATCPSTGETRSQRSARSATSTCVGGRHSTGFSHQCLEVAFSEVGCLKLELLRFSERLSESFSGGLDELRIACDLLDLGSGAVATHVVFLEYLLEGAHSRLCGR